MPEKNITQSKSWREQIPVHPAADLFLMMSEDELRELSENIQKNGMTASLVVWAQGASTDRDLQWQLLDGRNRLDAAERAGLAIKFDEYFRAFIIDGRDMLNDHQSPTTIQLFGRSGKRRRGVDPYAYVLSANIHRRHLTTEQRQELVTKLLKAAPEKSNRETAKLAKVDDKTVAKIRRKLEATAEIPQLTKTVGADGKVRRAPAPQKPKHTALKQTGLEEFTGRPQPAQWARDPRWTASTTVQTDAREVSQVMREIEPALRPGLLKELRMALDDLAIEMSPPKEPEYIQEEIDPLEIPDFLRRRMTPAEVDA
jgi:hypothetical protein